MIGMKRSDDHDLAAPYVLDALDADELRRFERHLAECDRCAHEVRVLSRDTWRLGRAAAMVPPPDLRNRVMAAVQATPQEPPAAPTGYGYSPRPATAAPSGRPGRARARSRRPRSVRYTAVLAGFGLAASAVLGVFLYRTNAELDRQQAEVQAAQQVNQVLSAPDATATASSDNSGKGITAVVSRRLGRAVVTVHGLPEVSQGHVYQLWLTGTQPGDTVRSVGLLGRAPGSGSTAPLIATGVSAKSTAFAVTVEPAGGSARPTTTPLTQLTLNGA
jgi:anti-sigma-K factor RskA